MREDMGIEAGKTCMKAGDDTEQLTEENRKRKMEFLDDLKIKVVPYGEHVEWTDWFKEIRRLQKQGGAWDKKSPNE